MISFDKYKSFFSVFSPKKPEAMIKPFLDEDSSNGVLTYSQVEHVLKAIKESVDSFHRLSKHESLKSCKQIRHDIQGLIEYVKNIEEELIIKEREETEKLVDVNRQHAQVFQKLHKDKTRLCELENHRQALEARRDALNKSIQELNSQMVELKEQIQVAGIRRVDALTDLIPGVGFVGGLVTGRYERMIPFYSQVRGIISVAGQDKECLQMNLDAKSKELESLNLEISSVKASVDEKRRVINLMNVEIDHLGAKKSELDATIKILGEQLTCVKRFHSSLRHVQNKYEFLAIDIENINKLVIANSLNRSVVDSFINDLRDVQISMGDLLIQKSGHASLQSSKQISTKVGSDRQNQLPLLILSLCVVVVASLTFFDKSSDQPNW